MSRFFGGFLLAGRGWLVVLFSVCVDLSETFFFGRALKQRHVGMKA